MMGQESSEEDSDDVDKVLKPDKPHEKTRLQDGALIINYEVQFEEEAAEEIVYAGGIKGIRALRKQRDVFSDQASVEDQREQIMMSKFANYDSINKGSKL